MTNKCQKTTWILTDRDGPLPVQSENYRVLGSLTWYCKCVQAGTRKHCWPVL